MATSCRLTRGMEATAPDRTAARAGARLPAAVVGRCRGRALAAAVTALITLAPDSLKKPCRSNLGLAMTSTAPADSASRLARAPRSVRVEQIITGVGRSAMILRRNV